MSVSYSLLKDKEQYPKLKDKEQYPKRWWRSWVLSTVESWVPSGEAHTYDEKGTLCFWPLFRFHCLERWTLQCGMKQTWDRRARSWMHFIHREPLRTTEDLKVWSVDQQHQHIWALAGKAEPLVPPQTPWIRKLVLPRYIIWDSTIWWDTALKRTTRLVIWSCI